MRRHQAIAIHAQSIPRLHATRLWDEGLMLSSRTGNDVDSVE